MTTSRDDSQRSAGRPRDPRIEQAALAATRELLVEVGYARLTVAAVAGRAGTTKPALYRRWPSLPHLVYDAAFPDALLGGMRLGDDLRADVARVVSGTRDAFLTPEAAAALPGLLAEFTSHPALHQALLARFEPVFSTFDERLRAAEAAGEVRSGTRAEDLMRLIIGAVLLGVMLEPDALDDAWTDRITTILLEGVRP